MKIVRLSLALLATATFLVGYAGTPAAFHSGGVAECGGCHSMHSPAVAPGATGGSYLLVATDPSSTCLTCHESPGDTEPTRYHVSTAAADMSPGTPPIQRSPGGDFGWLKKDYTFTVRGTTTTELGQTHGHNVVAADASYVADTENTTAPGGTFQSAQLGCESCHDPHGRARRLSGGSYVNAIYTPGATNAPIIGSGSYNNSLDPSAGQAVGVYRLLRGVNDSAVDGVTFVSVPIAIAPATYNQTEATNQVRVAYGASGINTWGNWCASCHPDMHSSGNYVHPIDQSFSTRVANNYNWYVKSGDLTGTSANSYSSLVPFIENTGDIATLKLHASNTNGYLNGPSGGDKVSCLSCHRAHASGWEYALRWNMEGEFMTYNSLYPGTDTTPNSPQFARGRTGAETKAAYYDRPVTVFASYQRVLCNKCHAKD